MSGHSKWSTIKHKKGAADAKRGKIFTKILKEIALSAKTSGDPAINPRLRLAIEKAKANNVPKDNIDKAIKRGTGELESLSYEEYIYEGYGNGGVGILVEILTDNKNRTGGEVRHIFTKSGNHMADAGAVSWNFERKGLLTIHNVKEETILEEALELGIQDIQEEDENCLLFCDINDLYSIQNTLKTKYSLEAEVTMKPKNTLEITNINDATALIDLLNKLEDHDDVQKVYANYLFSEAVIAELNELQS